MYLNVANVWLLPSKKKNKTKNYCSHLHPENEFNRMTDVEPTCRALGPTIHAYAPIFMTIKVGKIITVGLDTPKINFLGMTFHPRFPHGKSKE